MAVDLRIKEHPILDFKRGRKIKFYYRGKEFDAYEGETIGAALCAAGVDAFTRSVKYHRPRGMFCAIGKCSSCMMRVDGVPNVKTCVTAVRDGMRIEPQNCFPSPSRDLFNIIDKVGMVSLPEVYYRSFTHPRFANTIFLKAIRAMTGMGEFPTAGTRPTFTTKIKHKETEIAVVGGGPGGLSAAVHAARWGCKVTLIDENPRLGGQLIKQTHEFFGSRKHFAGVRGINIAEKLAEEITKSKTIEVLLNASVVGFYEGNRVAIVQDDTFVILQAKRVIVSTGAYEKTLIFENNDLPGVMGAGGVQTLMNVYGVKPGSAALVVGAGNVGLLIAYQLLQAGVEVRAVVEAMPKIGGYFVHAAKIRRMGVPIFTSHTIKKAWGRNRVEGATIVQLGEQWNEIPGTEKKINCDLICVSAGLKPTYELLCQAGCEMKFVSELGGHVPLRTQNMGTTVKGVYFAGDAGGIEEADTAMVGGKIAGISAALSLGRGGKEAEELRAKAIKELEELRSGPTSAGIIEGLKKVLIGG